MDTPNDITNYEPDIISVIEKCKNRITNQLNNKIFIEDNNNINKDIYNYEKKDKQSFHIENCNNSKFNINNKINNVLINNCNNITINLDKLIGKLELVRCKNCKVYFNTLPNIIQLDISNNINIYSKYTINYEIVNSHCNNLFINNNKLQTSVFDEQCILKKSFNSEPKFNIKTNSLKNFFVN